MRLHPSFLLLPLALTMACRSHGRGGGDAGSSAPPVAAAVHVSIACAPGPGCINCTDCACDPDEVAVSGGGFCGPNVMIETANQYGRSSADRVLNVWRIGCTNAPPGNAYALCMKGAK
jgi:hypothetical protein